MWGGKITPNKELHVTVPVSEDEIPKQLYITQAALITEGSNAKVSSVLSVKINDESFVIGTLRSENGQENIGLNLNVPPGGSYYFTVSAAEVHLLGFYAHVDVIGDDDDDDSLEGMEGAMDYEMMEDTDSEDIGVPTKAIKGKKGKQSPNPPQKEKGKQGGQSPGEGKGKGAANQNQQQKGGGKKENQQQKGGKNQKESQKAQETQKKEAQKDNKNDNKKEAKTENKKEDKKEDKKEVKTAEEPKKEEGDKKAAGEASTETKSGADSDKTQNRKRTASDSKQGPGKKTKIRRRH